MAITDMSDNSNKLGTTMESIQNAYAGFAKGNYTMLDNLKLGYGGTEAEMERLLETASEISGIDYDIDSFADVAEAIHVIQENLGISGTTAKEATSTLEGSLKTLQGAWENLTIGIANGDADVQDLATKFAESADVYLNDNLFPTIGTILTNIPTMVGTLGTEIGKKLPDIQKEFDKIPGFVHNMADNFRKNLPEISQKLEDFIPDIATTVGKNAGELASAGIDMLLALLDGVSSNLDVMIIGALSAINEFIDTIATEENLKGVVDSGEMFIVALGDGIIKALPLLGELMDKVGVSIFDMLWYSLTDEWDTIPGDNIVQKIMNMLTGNAPQSYEISTINDWWDKIWDGAWNILNQDTKNIFEAIDRWAYPQRYGNSGTPSAAAPVPTVNTTPTNVTVQLNGDTKKLFNAVVAEQNNVTYKSGIYQLSKWN